MLGRTYSAEEAAAIGWINAAVPDVSLDTVVDDWCARLLAGSPQALSLSKVSMNGPGDEVLASIRQGFEALTYMYETEEFREGTTAFLQHRAPHFRSRLDRTASETSDKSAE